MSGGGGHRVDPDHLMGSVDQMKRFERRLEAALADVDAKVNRLHATWSGAAAAKHRDAHLRWLQGAQEMRAALVVMRDIATTAHGNYTGAVSANVGIWSM